MKKENIQIVDVNIDDLKSQEINPRQWSKKEISDLTESIKKFGIVDPIICNSFENRNNVVIGGHFRLSIAKDLGYKTIPVVYLNIPNLEKEKELCLRLNRNTGSWDWDLLKEFDMNLLIESGFDDKDLSYMWDDVLEVENDEEYMEDENKLKKQLKDHPENITVKFGDIYQLGEHKICCGDANDLETVKKLVEDNLINMVYCDPPYNIGLDYEKGIGGTKSYGEKIDDNKTDSEYKKFLMNTINNSLSVCKPDCHIFYWCDEKYIGLIQNIYTELGIENKRVCLWIKNNSNPTPKIAFNKVFEPCVYGIKGKPFINSDIKNFNEIFNKEIGTGNELIDDILDLFNIWLYKRLPTIDYQHPTSKPPALHERALRRCSKIGDNVLDLFGGSGSTLIACEQLKRKCFLIEIQPLFIQLIINRYEQYAKRKAIKLN